MTGLQLSSEKVDSLSRRTLIRLWLFAVCLVDVPDVHLPIIVDFYFGDASGRRTRNWPSALASVTPGISIRTFAPCAVLAEAQLDLGACCNCYCRILGCYDFGRSASVTLGGTTASA